MTCKSHETDAPGTGEKKSISLAEVTREVRKDIVRGYHVTRRYRYSLAPLVTMGSLAGSGALATAFNAPSLAMAAGTVAVGGIGAVVARRKLAATTRRWWAGAVTCCSAAWLGTVAATGMAEPMPGLLALGTAVLGGPWWYHYRNRLRLPQAVQPVAAPVATFAPEVAVAVTDPIWDNKVVAASGPLAGAMSDGWTSIENGRTTGVWLPDNAKILTDAAIGMTMPITQLYRKCIGEVMIERHEDRREGHIQVTVFDQPPLMQDIPWKGPQLDRETGIFPIGTYADGRGQAMVRLYNRDRYGVYHTLVSGGTGSGKSIVLSTLIAEIEHSGLGVTWIIDPQGGQSLPEWMSSDKIDKKARTAEEAFELIRAAEAVMHANSNYLSNVKWVDEDGDEQVGKGWFEPTPEMPFLAVVIDEAHVLLQDKDFAAIVARIAKMGRKAGVMLILATQSVNQDEFGAGREGAAIRDNVGMGNQIVLRTKSKMTSAMLSLPIDPVKLPEPPGFGFAIGPVSPRRVMMRAVYSKKLAKWAKAAPGTRLHRFAQEAATRSDGKAASSSGKTLEERIVDHLSLSASAVTPGELVVAGLHSSWTAIQNALANLERQGVVSRDGQKFRIELQDHMLARLNDSR
jgi:hypothetical protein